MTLPHRQLPQNVGMPPRMGTDRARGLASSVSVMKRSAFQRQRLRVAVMARKNPDTGSRFDSWLDEEGIREEATAAAIKAVIARQLASEMKKKTITNQRIALLMKTSCAQVDRLLDPDNGSATIESLQRAARIVGRELRLQLV